MSRDRTYFPEEFLWRVFHSMALVAQTMEKKEFSDLEKGRNNGPSSGGYMVVHADIKPLNSKCRPALVGTKSAHMMRPSLLGIQHRA